MYALSKLCCVVAVGFAFARNQQWKLYNIHPTVNKLQPLSCWTKKSTDVPRLRDQFNELTLHSRKIIRKGHHSGDIAIVSPDVLNSSRIGPRSTCVLQNPHISASCGANDAVSFFGHFDGFDPLKSHRPDLSWGEIKLRNLQPRWSTWPFLIHRTKSALLRRNFDDCHVTDWLISDWLIGWFIHSFILECWLTRSLIRWFIDWSVHRSVGSLYMPGWRRQMSLKYTRRSHELVDSWLADWLIDWLIHSFIW